MKRVIDDDPRVLVVYGVLAVLSTISSLFVGSPWPFVLVVGGAVALRQASLWLHRWEQAGRDRGDQAR